MNNVLVFSLAKEGNINLTKNFKVKEFRCRDGSDPVFVHSYIPIICQIHRNHFKYPFTPTSTYRSLSYNASPKVGGATRSNHVYGKAVDIPRGPHTSPLEMYHFWDDLLGDFGELIVYNWGIHIGIQTERKRINKL